MLPAEGEALALDATADDEVDDCDVVEMLEDVVE